MFEYDTGKYFLSYKLAVKRIEYVSLKYYECRPNQLTSIIFISLGRHLRLYVINYRKHVKSKAPSKVDSVFLYFSVVKIAEHLEGVENTLFGVGWDDM
jgi:hypothetical protein